MPTTTQRPKMDGWHHTTSLAVALCPEIRPGQLPLDLVSYRQAWRARLFLKGGLYIFVLHHVLFTHMFSFLTLQHHLAALALASCTTRYSCACFASYPAANADTP